MEELVQMLKQVVGIHGLSKPCLTAKEASTLYGYSEKLLKQIACKYPHVAGRSSASRDGKLVFFPEKLNEVLIQHNLDYNEQRTA